MDNNYLKTYELEKKLSRMMLIRRIVLGVISVFFIVLGIVYHNLFMDSKEVTIFGEGIFQYDSVTYNFDLLHGVTSGIIGSVIAIVFFLVDMLCVRYACTMSNGNYITVYRGYNSVVYVNGEEADRLRIFSFNNVIEAFLDNGVRITVSFSRRNTVIAHISYSDGSPSEYI